MQFIYLLLTSDDTEEDKDIFNDDHSLYRKNNTQHLLVTKLKL